uniref:Uncharacterized protein n=1 Tax=Cacopsylla melanoneura TaxID=428564 RepID=A0A8D9ENX6_9HEMI
MKKKEIQTTRKIKIYSTSTLLSLVSKKTRPCSKDWTGESGNTALQIFTYLYIIMYKIKSDIYVHGIFPQSTSPYITGPDSQSSLVKILLHSEAINKKRVHFQKTNPSSRGWPVFDDDGVSNVALQGLNISSRCTMGYLGHLVGQMNFVYFYVRVK